MMRIVGVLFALALGGFAGAQTLDIYVIDVEGGNATLFVTPAHDSLLIDTGNAGAVASVRDAGRILQAMRDAGVEQIDHLIITHWHGDHFGGLAELASKTTIKEFIDHGPNVQPGELADNFLKTTYPGLYAKAKHTVAKPGDKILMAGLDVRVVASAGETIKTPLPGAGKANPYCANYKPGDNNAEDPQSVGIHVAFGKFRTVHLGDLTKNKEFELMCPTNRIGSVDLYLTSHHGLAKSGSPALVQGLQPRVVVMNNGTRKGGEPETFRVLHELLGLEDLWQLHWSYNVGLENTPATFVANIEDNATLAAVLAPPPQAPGARGGPGGFGGAAHSPAYLIKISAQQDGTFTVTNTRNGFSKTYRSRP